MKKYFDKDFFKFLVGFVLILLVSLTIILLAKGYELKLATDQATAETSK
jgi:hypothetical protein